MTITAIIMITNPPKSPTSNRVNNFIKLIINYSLKHYLQSSPNTKAHKRTKRIMPKTKMTNNLKNIDCAEFSFFFLKTLKILKRAITKKIIRTTIPNNKIIEIPLSIIFSKIFHHCNRSFNFINIVKNHQQTYYLYCA